MVQNKSNSSSQTFDVLDSSDTVRASTVITVAKSGGDYTTVQAAVNAAASGTTINIMNGTYKEKLKISTSGLHLVGQSNTGTIITYSDSNGSAGGTSQSASVTITASNFIAENIDFRNDFAYNGGSNQQAVAVACEGDQQYFNNCQLHGNQDTLETWSGTGRQYFNGCTIVGCVDFIFGNGTALFNNCTITTLNRSGSCISAPSTYSSTSYGLIFMGCNVGGSGSYYLGRPWHPSSSSNTIKSMAVYYKCSLSSIILAAGWTTMSGVSPSTERMYEYQNTGSGANTSRPQLSSSDAANYTKTTILNGWNP
jgi:pectinesterase